MLTTRDAYVALLQKRAMDESSIPANDSVDATNQEYAKNREDNRATLHSLFTQAGPVQSHQTAEIKKLFPNPEGTKISGHPLLKVAARVPFFEAVEQRSSFMKTASPLFQEMAFGAFFDELEKIAAR